MTYNFKKFGNAIIQKSNRLFGNDTRRNSINKQLKKPYIVLKLKLFCSLVRMKDMFLGIVFLYLVLMDLLTALLGYLCAFFSR